MVILEVGILIVHAVGCRSHTQAERSACTCQKKGRLATHPQPNGRENCATLPCLPELTRVKVFAACEGSRTQLRPSELVTWAHPYTLPDGCVTPMCMYRTRTRNSERQASDKGLDETACLLLGNPRAELFHHMPANLAAEANDGRLRQRFSRHDPFQDRHDVARGSEETKAKRFSYRMKRNFAPSTVETNERTLIG